MTEQNKGLSEEQLAEIRKAFNLFDANNNGKIEKSELSEIMKVLGLQPTKERMDEMMKTVDSNKNNVIDFDEFVSMMQFSE